VPSAAVCEVAPSSQWEVRTLFLDELQRHGSLQRGTGLGLLPPDRVVQQVRPPKAQRLLVDISGTEDSVLQKEIVESAAPSAPRVLQGAQVRMRITVANPDKSLSLDKRLLHGPQEHCWEVGSGARCELVELAAASMSLGETCVVTCGDPALYVDGGLGIGCASDSPLEYLLQVTDVQPREDPTGPEAILKWAEKQKEAAAMRLKDGMVQLALLKYRLLLKVLAAAPALEPWGAVELQRAWLLLNASKLNVSACLLRLERWEPTCQACTEVLAEEAKNVKARYRRGQALLKLGKLEDAQFDFQVALDVEPRNKEARRQLERCQLLLQKAAEKADFLRNQRGLLEVGKWE
ncbi:unnamed protein product, partial [Polarella glacialis]